MPIFEYRCKKCGAVNELLIFSTDKDLPKCGECGSVDLEKLLSTFSPSVKSELACGASSCPSQAGPTPGCSSGMCPLA